MKGRLVPWLAACLATTAVTFAASLAIGSHPVALTDVVAALGG